MVNLHRITVCFLSLQLQTKNNTTINFTIMFLLRDKRNGEFKYLMFVKCLLRYLMCLSLYRNPVMFFSQQGRVNPVT